LNLTYDDGVKANSTKITMLKQTIINLWMMINY